MNLTPNEREEILLYYAESCRQRFIEYPGDISTKMAVLQPQDWVQNCRSDAIDSIRKNHDTWERIAKVAEEYRKDLFRKEY